MIGLIISVFVLFLIWAYLMDEGKLDWIDKKVYQKMNIKEPWISFFKIFTNLASTIFFVIVCVLLVLFLKNKKLALFISVLMIFDSILVYTFKHLFKRERPNIKRLVKEKGFSYPSGHSTSSVCFYGFMIFLLGISSLSWPIKIILDISLILLILLIGYSRVFLGVHYFSDVVGGLLLGSSYILLFVYLMKSFINIL